MTIAAALIIALSGYDMTELAATAHVSLNTVRRAYAGGRLEVTTRRRLEHAASQLNLPAPPPSRDAVSRPELGVCDVDLQARRG